MTHLKDDVYELQNANGNMLYLGADGKSIKAAPNGQEDNIDSNRR